jgi:hypothetical protein
MDDFENSLPPGRLRVMQIAAGALIAGPTFFLALALFLVHIQNQGQGLAPPRVPVLSFFAAAWLAVTTLASYLLPIRLVRKNLRRIASDELKAPPGETADDVSQVLGLRQTSMLIALALHEGTAFLGCLAYLLEAQPLALGAAGLAILFMLLRFPTEYRVRTWMRQQLDWLEKAREQTEPPTPV